MWNQQFNSNSYRRYSYRPETSNGGRWGARAPYNPSYRGDQFQPSSIYTPSKKSGAKIKDGKNGKPAISAWKKTRNSFLTLIACPNNLKNVGAKDGHKMVNKRGQEYARWTGTLVEKNTGSISTVSCLYNLNTGKLYIPELKMVANPQAPNGGYFGNSYVSKRR